MAVVGSRRIVAPLPRVWRALAHPERWRSALPESVFPVAPRAEAVSEDTVTWHGDARAAKFALASDGEGTQLAYEAEGPEEEKLKPALERFLDALQSELAGPEEAGAQGPLIGAAKVVAQRPALPSVVFGMPLVFWGGLAVFLFIFVMMFGAYL